MRGRLTPDTYEMECGRVREMLQSEGKPHLKEFLEAWQG